MKQTEESKLSKPHAVCIPFPAQGHINPMLKLAKLLHIRGFNITFVNTDFNHRRLLKSRGPNSLDGLPSFRFESIPDGLPPSNEDATQDVTSLCEACKKSCLVPFRELVTRLNDNSNFPSITCIVSDTAMSFTQQVCEELGVPNVGFWTASGCSLWAFTQYPKLVEQDESYLDTIIDWIPGMEGIRLKHLPSFIRARVDEPSYIMMKYVMEEIVDKIPKFSALILNTFDMLENDVLQQMATKFPVVNYPIGPLHRLMLNNTTQDEDLKSIGSNLWKEDTHCLEWLDTKQPNSVVYVNFGSITVLSIEQVIEFAWGLANSKMNFLWIVRSDLVMGDSAMLPHEFLAETKERGLLVGWSPQEQVLSHPSIGGFLTHCGWNSIFESISFGVPMLCWPFFADQQTNCWFNRNRWGVGMEIDSNVKRDVIEELVRELMIGEKGKEMKQNALKWKKLAEKAINSSNGSSSMNFEKLVSHVLLGNALSL
ncbi:7-deoxyloganetin glucosyltransferase-like isoform X2 [Solanum dulcamara]|uniref:7-deoxyloganetin glucosyltransferase-like isoform X2 n=1 Tax=Solanum dulcamara TaxID=45834 RepID=UPI002485701B|nr:7-deoxyloganetin glucosyltransferase-like isoform X2 [Solanum dulcamara]